MFILRRIIKVLLKIIAVLLVLFIVIPGLLVAIPYNGSGEADPVGDLDMDENANVDMEKIEASKKGNIPLILVHGMMGWGEDAKQTETMMPYWGMMNGNLLASLREDGYEVYAPSVGPVSSAYDRACELYAQLTGTRTDYGEAHAKRYGHERYGRDYTGKALMGEPWDMTTAINLAGHSFGGPTLIVFASIMAYGVTEEVETSGDNVSEFFKGGHAGAINAIATLESPSNGTPAANYMNDTALAYAFVIGMNVMTSPKRDMDPMLDQWGMTEKIDLIADLKLSFKKDHCGYDMTLNGAKELQNKFPSSKTIRYMSYSATLPEDGKAGDAVLAKVIEVPGKLISQAANGTIVDGHILKSEWKANDGLVPKISAQYPMYDGSTHVDYVEGASLKAGVWTMMPNIENSSHGAHCSATDGNVIAFYNMYTEMIDIMNR
ncbi:MAG: hypothetical protein Q4F70_00430 [Clostridia bacterium]|nr:hypothetical protein [Clostridia bacterium]